jgi:hypothetical protein
VGTVATEVVLRTVLVVELGIVLGGALEVMMGRDEPNLTKSIFPLESLPLQVRTEKVRKLQNHRLTMDIKFIRRT